MVWPRVNEGRRGYHQEYVKHASAGKEKKGRPKNRWLDNIRDVMKAYKKTEDMAHYRSVWHIQRPVHYYMEEAYKLEGETYVCNIL